MTRVLGVDGCRKGWVAVGLCDGAFERAFFEPDLVSITLEEAAVVAIDMPIGLPAVGPRPADEEARGFVGERWHSVFMTPPEAVLRCKTFAEATSMAKRLSGKGITQQAFALRKRIFEVAAAAASDQRIIEVHPEVCFRALAGKALAWSKKTWNGFMLRRRLLEAAGIELPPGEIADVAGAGSDDVLDAAVAAWSAHRYATAQAKTLPEPRPADPSQAGGVIWY